MTALLSLLFLFTTLAHGNADTALGRTNGLLKFIIENQGLRNMALGSVMNNRCNRYLNYSEVGTCKAAVKRMIQLLDYDIIVASDKSLPLPTRKSKNDTWTPSSFVFVAFKSNLIYFLSNPKVTTYLSDLNQQLYQYMVGNQQSLNIWDLTKSYFKSDYLTAAALAVLFQDTSKMKLHLAYLEKAGTSGNSHFVSNKELLGRVIDTINQILDTSEDHYRQLFYPKEVERNVNRNIYHFYVPMFLSMALRNENAYGMGAYYAPLMLTLTYEFVTFESDYRNLYSDPARIDPYTSKGLWTLKDIFGGYCGANFGLRGANFNTNFEIVKASFARSTEDGVALLLRH